MIRRIVYWGWLAWSLGMLVTPVPAVSGSEQTIRITEGKSFVLETTSDIATIAVATEGTVEAVGDDLTVAHTLVLAVFNSALTGAVAVLCEDRSECAGVFDLDNASGWTGLACFFLFLGEDGVAEESDVKELFGELLLGVLLQV